MIKHTLFFLFAAVILIGLHCCSQEKSKNEKPNILLIMADDMGFSDIGCYGGEIQTPTIDRLAEDGVRFKQFYNSARCCPTRASLMTGLYPHQTGIGHMTNTPTNPTQHNYGLPAYQGYLNQNSITIAEMLKPAGYKTLMCGKWHLGYHGKDKWPLQRGFDKYYGIIAGAANYFKPEAPRGLTLGNENIKPDEDYYITDGFTDYAIQFLKENNNEGDKPFFMYLAYTSPHWPLNAPQEDIDKYKGKYMQGWSKMRQDRLIKMKEIGLIDEDVELSEQAGPNWDSIPEDKKTEMDLRMAIYAAQIDRMDQNIGKLVRYLEESGELDNTIIFFLSDNGGCAEGGMLGGGKAEILETKEGYFLTYGQAWANASNTPFKMYKHWVHEGGISTPLIVHWPKGIPEKTKGKWIDQYSSLPDIAATIQAVTGAEYPETHNGLSVHKLVGKNILPAILENTSIHEQPIFWEHEGNCAVRDGDLKMVKKYPKDWELYNLKTDRAESKNIIAQMPEKAEELEEKYQQWAEENNVVEWDTIRSIINKK